MGGHDCKHEEDFGRFKEFMLSIKGFKTLLGSIIFTILIQIGVFLILWGGLNEVVKKNSDQIWNHNTPCVTDNTRNIDKILASMEAWQKIREMK
jgi:hypothetical protein